MIGSQSIQPGTSTEVEHQRRSVAPSTTQ